MFIYETDVDFDAELLVMIIN